MAVKGPIKNEAIGEQKISQPQAFILGVAFI
jgi:hypothetical protein